MEVITLQVFWLRGPLHENREGRCWWWWWWREGWPVRPRPIAAAAVADGAAAGVEIPDLQILELALELEGVFLGGHLG